MPAFLALALLRKTPWTRKQPRRGWGGRSIDAAGIGLERFWLRRRRVWPECPALSWHHRLTSTIVSNWTPRGSRRGD